MNVYILKTKTCDFLISTNFLFHYGVYKKYMKDFDIKIFGVFKSALKLYQGLTYHRYTYIYTHKSIELTSPYYFNCCHNKDLKCLCIIL